MTVDIDCDDLPEIFVRALYGFGPEIKVWSRDDALAEANNGRPPKKPEARRGIDPRSPTLPERGGR